MGQSPSNSRVSLQTQCGELTGSPNLGNLLLIMRPYPVSRWPFYGSCTPLLLFRISPAPQIPSSRSCEVSQQQWEVGRVAYFLSTGIGQPPSLLTVFEMVLHSQTGMGKNTETEGHYAWPTPMLTSCANRRELNRVLCAHLCVRTGV